MDLPFSPGVRRALETAMAIAGSGATVAATDVLRALVSEPRSAAGRILHRLGAVEVEPAGVPAAGEAGRPLMSVAASLARARGDRHVGTAHVLAALASGPCREPLARRGVTPDVVWSALAEIEGRRGSGGDREG